MAVFHIELTTRRRVTVECDTYAAAEERARSFVEDLSALHHHGEATTFAVVDPNARRDCYYFGCLDQAGHFLRGTSSKINYYENDLPWKQIDGGLLASMDEPDEATGRVRAVLGKRGERWWWAFVWWDRSVDRRGGSNSGLYVSGFGPDDRDAAFAHACEKWPAVVGRQLYPLKIAEPR